MSMGIGTPVNQVRHTNVAVVRLSKKGRRFEIACYRNKVLSWRNKIEQDLGEVLQIDTIFTNVSKGMMANNTDLFTAFNTHDRELILAEILDKGELQISEEEREVMYENMTRDVASIIADKTINPETNRPYTINIVMSAMTANGISVDLRKNAKPQALEVVRKLKELGMPIARSNMCFKVSFNSANKLQVIGKMLSITGVLKNTFMTTTPDLLALIGTDSTEDVKVTSTTIQSERDMADANVSFEADPECYRQIQDIGQISLVEILQSLNKQDGKPVVVDISKYTITSTKPNETEREPKGIMKNKTSNAIQEKAGDDDSQDTEEAYMDTGVFAAGMVSKKKKKKKNKNRNKAAEEDIGEEGHASDSDDNSSIPTVSGDKSVTESESDQSFATTSSSKKGGKLSKKAKKREKELELEHQKQRGAMQMRIDLEKEKAQQARLASTEDVTTTAALQANGTSEAADATVKKCNTCGGAFDAQAYRLHFKSEWHRHNLKRKMKTLPIIGSEEEFLNLSMADLQI